MGEIRFIREDRNPKRSRQEIEEILSAEVERARWRQQETGKRFREIVGDVPGLTPAPDGALRIQQAGAEYRACLRDLMKTMTRFHDFHLRGIVPEDL